MSLRGTAYLTPAIISMLRRRTNQISAAINLADPLADRSSKTRHSSSATTKASGRTRVFPNSLLFLRRTRGMGSYQQEPYPLILLLALSLRSGQFRMGH